MVFLSKVRNAFVVLILLGSLLVFIVYVYDQRKENTIYLNSFKLYFHGNSSDMSKNRSSDAISDSNLEFKRPNLTSSRQVINWYRCEFIYIDSYRSGVYYVKTGSFLLSILLPAKKISIINNYNIKININLFENSGKKVFTKLYDAKISNNYVISNEFYIHTTIRVQLDSSVQEYLTSSKNDYKLLYQLQVNGHQCNELKVLVVYHTAKKSTLARLTKCLFLAGNNKNAEQDFRFMVNLTIQSKFDSIYICNFNDKRIHATLKEFASIKEIFLDYMPNFTNDKEENFTNFDDIGKVAPNDPNGFFDVTSEYIYNLNYPGLIDLYDKVYAGDFDQLLIPTFGKNVSEHIEAIQKDNKIYDRQTSIYLPQAYYWENINAEPVLKNIKLTLDNVNQTNTAFPISIKNNVYLHHKFGIIINDESQLNYASDLVASFFKRSSLNEMCRVIFITFNKQYIYGQTVHATQSSELIKLVEPGSHFPSGIFKKVTNYYMTHYRDYFQFNLILDNGHFNIRQFHFDANILKYCL